MILQSKTAVVTGSTSGIGLATARAMAKEGANVLINGFGKAEDIEKERAGIEADFGVKAIYSPADMTKPAEIAAMVALAESTFGSVDVLVNNAGIQFVSPIEDFPIEKWDQIIAINLTSAFHAIRAAVPGMKKRGWGRIISTASAHSLVASPFKSAYVAAKARHRGPDQDRGPRSSPPTASPSTASARAMSGRRWSRTRSPTP
jgi:3-hydroxybutyrate dehydrogenase